MRVLFMVLFLFTVLTANTFAQKNYAKQHFQQGTEFANAEKFEEAIESYKNALKVVKKDKQLKSKIHYNIGVGLYQMKKFDDAENAFNKAIKLNKKYVQAIYSLGLTKIELGELNSAEATFRRVINLDKKHSEAYFDLGVVLMLRNKFNIAKVVFEKAVEYKTTRMDEARKYLEKINSLQSKIELAEFNFQMAFNYFVAKREANYYG